MESYIKKMLNLIVLMISCVDLKLRICLSGFQNSKNKGKSKPFPFFPSDQHICSVLHKASPIVTIYWIHIPCDMFELLGSLKVGQGTKEGDKDMSWEQSCSRSHCLTASSFSASAPSQWERHQLQAG